jgi:hypothetical protein
MVRKIEDNGTLHIIDGTRNKFLLPDVIGYNDVIGKFNGSFFDRN